MRTLSHILDRLSIRGKLFGYAFLLILLLLSLAAFVLYQVGEIRNRHIPARAAAREIEAALLTMRTHELDFINEADSLNTEFYLKHQSPSLDAWQQNYRQFEENHAKLTTLFSGGQIGSELQALQPLATSYRDTFVALNGAYRERGFQSFGREGVLRQRAASLQTSLAGNTGQLALFLQTLDAQNNFLLYREPSSVETFKASATRLESQLTKPTDKTLFNEYTKLFDETASIYQKIGLTSTEGLRGQLNSTMKDIVPHIQAIEASVLASTNASIAQVGRSVLVAAAVLSVVAVLFAFVLARLIIDKLALLGKASKQIASGNLTYRLSAGSTDELGQLASSFNTMAQELQDSRQKLHERARALTQSVKRFELVSRAVNEAVYELDIRDNKLSWGEGLVSVFGYKSEQKETTVEWWTDRIHIEDADDVNDSLSRRVSQHAQSWKKEYRFKRADGEYVYCLDRRFIEYRHGEPVRMVGSLIDISRQKALDQAKDQFVSVASHQLRTPLGSIRWNLELLLENRRSLSKDIASYADAAYQSTLRMTGLVSDLLSVARIEQGRVQNIPEKSDLVEVVKAAITEIRPLANKRSVSINTAGLKDKHANVILDPKRFREVVQNLLSNAVKYTRHKGKVTVSVEQRAKDFVFSIADNGIGIPLEDQSKLFGKFYRATNVTTTDTEGSGLGLFVVRSYVESWGGSVWFESKINQGTTFYVSIPHKPRMPR